MTKHEREQALRDYVTRKIRDALATLEGYDKNGVVPVAMLKQKIELWIANPRAAQRDLERLAGELDSLVHTLDVKYEVEGILDGVEQDSEDVAKEQAEEQAERERERRERQALHAVPRMEVVQ